MTGPRPCVVEVRDERLHQLPRRERRRFVDLGRRRERTTAAVGTHGRFGNGLRSDRRFDQGTEQPVETDVNSRARDSRTAIDMARGYGADDHRERRMTNIGGWGSRVGEDTSPRGLLTERCALPTGGAKCSNAVNSCND